MKRFFIILFLVFFFALGAFLYYYFVPHAIPLTPQDEALLVYPKDLVDYFKGMSFDENALSVSKKRYNDGGELLMLEYSSAREDTPYIAITISKEKNQDETSLGFTTLWNGYEIGLTLGNRDFLVREDENFILLGDETRFGFVLYGDETVGNVCVIRSGAHIYSLIFLGIYFDDADLFSHLMSSRISAMGKIEDSATPR